MDILEDQWFLLYLFLHDCPETEAAGGVQFVFGRLELGLPRLLLLLLPGPGAQRGVDRLLRPPEVGPVGEEEEAVLRQVFQQLGVLGPIIHAPAQRKGRVGKTCPNLSP